MSEENVLRVGLDTSKGVAEGEKLGKTLDDIKKKSEGMSASVKATPTSFDAMVRGMSGVNTSSQLLIGGMSQAGKAAEEAAVKIEKTAVSSNLAVNAFEKLKRGLGEFTPVLATLGIAFAGLGLAEFTASVIEAGSAAEQSFSRMNAILAATGNTTGLLTKDLEELSVAVEKTTVFDDEKAKDAISALAVFDQVSGEVFKRAIKDSADFATLMQSDLPEASRTLGRALQNPAENLQQLNRGMKLFSQSQIDNIKAVQEHNGVLAAQELVLARLESKTTGLAAAQKNTLQGSTESLTNAWDDFKESLANSSGILSTVTSLVHGLQSAVEALNSLITASGRPTFNQQAEDEMKGLNALIEQLHSAETAKPDVSNAFGLLIPDTTVIKKNISELMQFMHSAAVEHAHDTKEQVELDVAAQAAANARAAAAKEQAVADKKAADALDLKKKADQDAADAAKAADKARKDATQSLLDQIQGLKDDATATTLSSKEKFVYTEVLKAEATIKKGLVQDGDKYVDQVKKEAAATFDATEVEKVRKDNLETIQKIRQDAANKAADDAKKNQDLLQTPFENAIEQIQGDFKTFFTSIQDDGLDSFTKLSQNVKKVFQDLASDLLSLLVIKPVIQPVIQQAGITGGGGGGGLGSATTSGAGGLLGGLNFGSLFGGNVTSATAGVRNQTTGQFEMAQTGAGGFSFGTAGLGVVASIGDIIQGLHPSGPGSNYGQLGSGIGGGIGSIAGSFFGPIGGVVGQALGSMIGGIIGGLIKGPNNYPKAAAYFSTGDQGVFAGPNIQTANGGDPATAKVFQRPTVDLFRTLFSQYGSTGAGITPGGDYGYSLGQNVLGGIQNKAGVFNAVVGKQVFSNLGSGDNAVATFVAESLKAAANKGSLTGFSDVFVDVFKKANIRTAEELQSTLDFASFYDELKNGKKNTTDAETALKALNLQFAAMRDKAKELGLSLDVVDHGLEDAKKKLTTDFDKSIKDQILSITEPLQLALEQLNEAQKKRVDEAKALGADLVEVERLNALERQQVIEQFNNQQLSSLAAFYRRITYGDLSLASPTTQLSGSRATFEAAAAQALSGDLNAKANIQGYAEAFLQSSQGVNASSSAYFADLARVQEVIGSLLGGTNSITATIVASNSELGRLLAANNNELSELRRTTEDQAADIALLVAQLGRLLSAQAA